MDLHNVIQTTWNEFSKQMIVPSAGPIQRTEMRLCFFAGATIFKELLVMSKELHGTYDTSVVDAVICELDMLVKQAKQEHKELVEADKLNTPDAEADSNSSTVTEIESPNKGPQ